MSENEAEKDRILFSQLIITFYDSAWQSLGKIMNPITGKVERNLDIARNSIDILDMLKRRTAGNLSPEETNFIDHALYQLKMNYVEEVEADKKAKAGAEATGETARKAEEEQPAAETAGQAEKTEKEKPPEKEKKDRTKKPDKGKSTKKKTRK